MENFFTVFLAAHFTTKERKFQYLKTKAILKLEMGKRKFSYKIQVLYFKLWFISQKLYPAFK